MGENRNRSLGKISNGSVLLRMTQNEALSLRSRLQGHNPESFIATIYYHVFKSRKWYWKGHFSCYNCFQSESVTRSVSRGLPLPKVCSEGTRTIALNFAYLQLSASGCIAQHTGYEPVWVQVLREDEIWTSKVRPQELWLLTLGHSHCVSGSKTLGHFSNRPRRAWAVQYRHLDPEQLVLLLFSFWSIFYQYYCLYTYSFLFSNFCSYNVGDSERLFRVVVFYTSVETGFGFTFVFYVMSYIAL